MRNLEIGLGLFLTTCALATQVLCYLLVGLHLGFPPELWLPTMKISILRKKIILFKHLVSQIIS